MAVFDWVESAGTALEEAPRVARTQFGDGYEERAPDGLNPITQSWQLQFTGIDREVASDIVAFWRARINAAAGQEAFDWTPLWHVDAIRVTCSRWTVTQDQTPETVSITATFKQEHLA
ncbi:MAG: hypothetical protein RL375_1897 [Pseudomonadota bacterium]|jgi:phage-related protein